MHRLILKHEENLEVLLFFSLLQAHLYGFEKEFHNSVKGIVGSLDLRLLDQGI